MTSVSSTSTLTISPTDLNTGTYTVRVKFAKVIDTTVYLEDTFLVEVYPETEYGSTLDNEECLNNVFPAFF